MRTKILLLLTLVITPPVALADVNFPIDIGIVCNDKTASSNEIYITSDPSFAGISEGACVEKSSYISGIRVTKVKLGYLAASDAYVLFLFSDMEKSSSIQAMSKGNLMRDMVIVKNGKLVADAVIGAPLQNGVISIGVANKLAGEKLGNLLSGKNGMPQK